MPRGITSPEAMAKRLEKRRESSEEMDKFLIKLNDSVRVTRDKYNIIISQKRTSESGTVYVQPLGYYNTFLCEDLLERAEKAGVTRDQLEIYKNRVKKCLTGHDNGALVLHMPSGFVFDERDATDIVPEEESTDEGDD